MACHRVTEGSASIIYHGMMHYGIQSQMVMAIAWGNYIALPLLITRTLRKLPFIDNSYHTSKKHYLQGNQRVGLPNLGLKSMPYHTMKNCEGRPSGYPEDKFFDVWYELSINGSFLKVRVIRRGTAI